MKNTHLLGLTSVTAIFALCVIMLGAYTRLADAGLGCPDWPTCYGHLWIPDSADQISKANERYAQTPVETDKTWPEQLHRILAKNLGLLILLIFFLALKKNLRREGWVSVATTLALLVLATVVLAVQRAGIVSMGHILEIALILFVIIFFANLMRLSQKKQYQQFTTPFLLPSLVAGLVILQGLFGMWTVTLKLWPQVVTVHLLGGFTIFSLLVLLVQRFGDFHWAVDTINTDNILKLQFMALATLIVVFLQIALGGWVASNYAALACPDFPMCQNQWLPKADYSQGFNIFQDIGPNYLGGQMDNFARIAIHFAHRIGAIVASVFVLTLALKMFAIEILRVRLFAATLLFVLVMQISLGIANIVAHLPLGNAVAHNAVGALLLAFLVVINHRIATVKNTGNLRPCKNVASKDKIRQA